MSFSKKIPILYTNHGRARGCKNSAESFLHVINYVLSSNKTEILNRHLRNSNTLQRLIRERDLELFTDIYPGLRNSKYKDIIDITRYTSKVSQLKKFQKELYKLDFSVRPEAYDVQSSNYNKLLFKSKEDILFQINMIQTPNQRGSYAAIGRDDKDIVFCKGLDSDNSMDVVQNLYTARYSGFGFFPKYMPSTFNRNLDSLKFQIKYEQIDRAIKLSEKACKFLDRLDPDLSPSEKIAKVFEPNGSVSKIPLRIAYYNRMDTCPVQQRKYKDYITKIKKDEKLNGIFQISFESFGFGNNLNSYELCNLLNTTDILLYAAPTSHRDPYPNTVLDAISRGCLVLRVDKSYLIPDGPPDDICGIDEIQMMFPNMFLDPDKGISNILEWYHCDTLFGHNYKKQATQVKKSIQQKLNSLELLVYMFIVDKLHKEIGAYLDTLNELKRLDKKFK